MSDNKSLSHAYLKFPQDESVSRLVRLLNIVSSLDPKPAIAADHREGQVLAGRGTDSESPLPPTYDEIMAIIDKRERRRIRRFLNEVRNED